MKRCCGARVQRVARADVTYSADWACRTRQAIGFGSSSDGLALPERKQESPIMAGDSCLQWMLET